MNIGKQVWEEAEKRGLDWVATGGNIDFVHRVVKNGETSCELTLLNKSGISPQTLGEPCEVTVALHSSGYCSISLQFSNVIAALDFMQDSEGVCFIESQYKEGKEADAGFYE